MPSDENYGDVSLNLPASWSRSRYERQKHINAIVGHVEGVADLRLTKTPKQQHQFVWSNPRDLDLLDSLREQGYEYVKQSTWTKNEKLWTWDAEGFCLRDGDRAMARPAELFYQEREEKQRNPRDLNKAADSELASKMSGNVIARGLSGERLIPTART